MKIVVTHIRIDNYGTVAPRFWVNDQPLKVKFAGYIWAWGVIDNRGNMGYVKQASVYDTPIGRIRHKYFARQAGKFTVKSGEVFSVEQPAALEREVVGA